MFGILLSLVLFFVFGPFLAGRVSFGSFGAEDEYPGNFKSAMGAVWHSVSRFSFWFWLISHGIFL